MRSRFLLIKRRFVRCTCFCILFSAAAPAAKANPPAGSRNTNLINTHHSAGHPFSSKRSQLLQSLNKNGDDNWAAALLNLNEGATILLDGCMTIYDPAYNNGVDDDDITKMINGGETVSSIRQGTLLAIERKQTPAATDTMFINFIHQGVHQYSWDIQMSNMTVPGLTAYLVDKFTHTYTPANLNGIVSYSFNVINNPQSYAADRFMIIYRNTLILPAGFLSVNAVRTHDHAARISWQTGDELNVASYSVESSADGSSFQQKTFCVRHHITAGNDSYTSDDHTCSDKETWYRIAEKDLNGNIHYSATVKLPAVSGGSMSICPNPVTDGIVNLHFDGQSKGNYTVQIVNPAGAIVYAGSVQLSNEHFVYRANTGKKTMSGIYIANVINESGKMTAIPFITR